MVLGGGVLLGPGAAHATVTYGPTPDGAGNYFVCDFVGAYHPPFDAIHSSTAQCAYGTPAAGVTLTGIEVVYADGTVDGGSCHTVGAGVLGCTILYGGVYGGGDPGRVIGTWSDSGTWQGALDVQHPASYYIDAGAPSERFESGITGTVDTSSVTTPPLAFLNTKAGTIGNQLVSYGEAGVGVVFAVLLVALGGMLAVRVLRGWVAPATAPDDGDDMAGIVSESWHDSTEDDEGQDDSGDDDTADIDGNDTAEDSGNAGIGDYTECVSCGAELEYGWDYDYCPECSEVG